ncbi:hypothetical protein EC988_010424, partial [Linderina pennispora]
SSAAAPAQQQPGPLPSPLETQKPAPTHKQLSSRPLPTLSTQTVTTTTVTTTTVTTYPPLKIPRVDKQKEVNARMYPLARTKAPAALEQFALESMGQQLYFEYKDLADAQNE